MKTFFFWSSPIVRGKSGLCGQGCLGGAGGLGGCSAPLVIRKLFAEGPVGLLKSAKFLLTLL